MAVSVLHSSETCTYDHAMGRTQNYRLRNKYAAFSPLNLNSTAQMLWSDTLIQLQKTRPLKFDLISYTKVKKVGMSRNIF